MRIHRGTEITGRLPAEPRPVDLFSLPDFNYQFDWRELFESAVAQRLPKVSSIRRASTIWRLITLAPGHPFVLTVDIMGCYIRRPVLWRFWREIYIPFNPFVVLRWPLTQLEEHRRESGTASLVEHIATEIGAACAIEIFPQGV